MGYFSRLAVELLEEGREDRELACLGEDGKPVTNYDLAIEQQETQYSIWNKQYREQLEQTVASTKTKKDDAPKVYKKTRGLK